METKLETKIEDSTKVAVLSNDRDLQNPEQNIVTIEGTVVSEPYEKQFENGNKMLLFTLSHSNNFRTKSGEQVRITEWFQVVSWNRVAETIKNCTHRGSRVRLKGRLHSSAWKDKEGASYKNVQIVATEILNNAA